VKSVRIVHLDQATLDALAAGELPVASPVPLTDHLTGPEHRPLWRRRSRQVAANTAAAAWVTGVVWAPAIGVAVGRAGFHGPPDDAGMVEVGYAIDRATGAEATRGPHSPPRSTAPPGSRRSVRCGQAYGRTTWLHAGWSSRSASFPVGQQWDDEDGLETVYERPA
jgi:hypothetical protein